MSIEIVFNCLKNRDITLKEVREKKGIKIEQKNKNKKRNKKKKNNRKYLNRIPKKYKAYIKSVWWENRKNIYWRKHRKICRKCFSSLFVDLHHAVYNREDFGYEPDDTLYALCRNCHETFHKEHKLKKDMLKETRIFIGYEE